MTPLHQTPTAGVGDILPHPTQGGHFGRARGKRPQCIPGHKLR